MAAIQRPHFSDEELSAFAAGRIDNVAAEQVEAHLLECDDCGSRLDRLIGGDSFVARLREMSEQRDIDVLEMAAIGSTADEYVAETTVPLGAGDRLIGTTLRNHQLISVLGKGGMGVVYRAEDQLIGREVAIKVLHASVAGDEAARTRFLGEARSQGRLNHPNVVTIYEIGELEATMFIVMELVEGGSIGDRLQATGRLDWQEATRILMQACRGLAAAHSAGLIHRDIKPENLLVDGDGQVKLSDFGLAKSIDAVSVTVTNQLVGTPQFMSPEQCRCASVDSRSDVYQLGATYFALLTGKKPYEYATTPLQAIDAHCRSPVPDPREIHPDLPDECAEIVAEAMAKDAKDRYQSADEMFADLIVLYDSKRKTEPFGPAVAPTPKRDGPPQRYDHPSARSRLDVRPRPRIAALVLALLAAMAMVGYFSRLPRRPAVDDPAAAASLAGAIDSHAPPIRIGVLHSLTGTMSESESPLVDAVLLAVDELNRAGGLLGRRIEPIVADGRSDPATFTQEAEHLISEERVCTVFGCWTSASRKTVVPIFERLDHLLVYPVQYEGVEQSPNVIYMGAAPNQQIIPAVKWAYAFENKRRFFLVGSDYVFPRAANAIIKDELSQLGRAELVGEVYLALGSFQVADVVAEIERARPDVILNTINGDSNIAFFRALRSAGITPAEIPTISFSLGEVELQQIDAAHMVGHYASWNYFQSIDSAENREFVRKFKSRYGPRRVISDPMEAAYVGVHLWAKAVAEAGSTRPDEIRTALRGAQLDAPQGLVKIDPATQHAYKTARIGRVKTDGQFELVWEAKTPAIPIPYPATRSTEAWDTFLQGLHHRWGGRWSAPPPSNGKTGVRPAPP